ncbi:phosphotransferase family protein [Poseidonocella pacifica]|uniref:phosphotransferase family protein n=1 Tax=Poseidonocella pacifica TaxID=871651 RepID=UPI001586F93B|nr:phosphotransferase [Poseidonocella pacifica]
MQLRLTGRTCGATLRQMFDPEEILSAAARIEAALPGAQAKACLRAVPNDRAVFSGHLNDVPAVFRLRLPEALAREEIAELRRMQPHMDGPDQIPLILAESGPVFALSMAAGTSVIQQMESPDHRTVLVARAAQWLRRYTAPTEQTSQGQAKRFDLWLRKAAEQSRRQPHPALAALEAQVLDKMRTLAAPAVWRTAICHGDFHPGNLIYDGEVMTGIDTGGSARLPLYKDIARFAAHAARRNLMIGTSRRFGVDAATLDHFSKAFTLNDEERTVLLPFFVGFELLVRVESAKTPAWRLEIAEEMLRNYLC